MSGKKNFKKEKVKLLWVAHHIQQQSEIQTSQSEIPFQAFTQWITVSEKVTERQIQ